MRGFVVELYFPREDRGGADAVAASIRAALETHAHESSEVRFVNAVFVPDDETCLLFLEARSIEDLRKTLRRADLAADRIAEALTVGGPRPLAG
jgi:hypothetical protein